MVTISPVYVTAIKRGGGVLVSSLAGIVLFGENLEGRTLPIAIIVAAVVMLVM
jgi:multidrug transporter EmrE-like cation transporter